MTYKDLLGMVDVKEVDGILYGTLKIELEGSLPYFSYPDGTRAEYSVAEREMKMWICNPISEAFEK